MTLKLRSEYIKNTINTKNMARIHPFYDFVSVFFLINIGNRPNTLKKCLENYDKEITIYF